MEIKNAIHALAALAQQTRLEIFRLLVVVGPDGLAVGKIAEQLGLANATLSFHLKELTNAGLTNATPNGRSIFYAANFTTMNTLIEYLTENCCVGAKCERVKKTAPVCRVSPSPSQSSTSTQKKSRPVSTRRKP